MIGTRRPVEKWFADWRRDEKKKINLLHVSDVKSKTRTAASFVAVCYAGLENKINK